MIHATADPDRRKMARSPKRKSRAVVKFGNACAVVVLVTWAQTAPAQSAWPDGLVVDWQAPSTCPDAEHVRGRVVSLLSAPARSAAIPHPTTFRAQVTPTTTGFRLEVATTSALAAETKIVDAERCEMIAEALALIVAYAVDPASSSLRPLASPPAEQPSPEAPSPQPSERTSSSPNAVGRTSNASNASSSTLPVALGPRVATGAGVLPMPAFAVGGAIALGDRPRWEIEGRYWPARQAELATDMGPGAVRVSLLSARFSACLPWSGDGRFSACAGAEIGRMRGEGTGVTTPDLGDSWWAAPSAGVVARLPVAQHFDVRLRLDVGVPLFRPSFTIQRVDVLREVEGFRPAPVFAVLTFEPEVTFFATEPRDGGHP